MDDVEKARVVQLILRGRTKEAMRLVCESFGKQPPKMKVGRVKGQGRALAVYLPRRSTIYFSDGSLTRNPFVVLHELYHHIRFLAEKHRGTEKHANKFAMEFIRAFSKLSRSPQTPE